jgi:hypothetical protein
VKTVAHIERRSPANRHPLLKILLLPTASSAAWCDALHKRRPHDERCGRDHNPPTKRPLVQLMKQARALGVGVLIATQNPMDLDYRALSNAGVWALGTLQTDADRERVFEGPATGDRKADQVIDNTVQQLAKGWFVMRDMHAGPAPVLPQPRYAMTYMRGPNDAQSVDAGGVRERKPASVATSSIGET